MLALPKQILCLIVIPLVTTPTVNAQTDSPEIAFEKFRRAFNSGDWKPGLSRISPELKRVWVQKIVNSDEFFQHLKQPDKSFNSKAAKATYSEISSLPVKQFESNKLNHTLVRIATKHFTSSDDLIVQYLPEILRNEPSYNPSIRLQIDGVRAKSIVTRESKQINTHQMDSESVEFVYFRKNDGIWKICTVREWARNQQTMPDNKAFLKHELDGKDASAK